MPEFMIRDSPFKYGMSPLKGHGYQEDILEDRLAENKEKYVEGG